MSTQSSIRDIRNQEEDNFEHLGQHDFTSTEAGTSSALVIERSKQNLSASSDSPFSRNNQEIDETELRRLKKKRVADSQEETNGNKQQLDFVDNRVGEMKKASGYNESSHNDCRRSTRDNSEHIKSTNERSPRVTSNEETNKIKSFKRGRTTRKQVVDHETKALQQKHDPRLRPLTGKSDCICDQRTSVGHNCAGPAQASSVNHITGFGLDRYKVE